MTSLLVERDAGVVTATMNRPHRRNALDLDMMGRLKDLLEEVHDTSTDRVLVLTGAGGAFCSGSDLDDRKNDPRHPLERLRWIGKIALGLQQLGKPVIAKVEGAAVGGGLALALGCDLIIASSEARLGTAWTQRALSPDLGAAWLLPRMIGLHRAKELVFLGEMLTANEALAMGLINRVVPAPELDAAVRDWARNLALGPPLALSMSKSLLVEGMNASMAQVLESEARALAVNIQSADGLEAMDAFKSKRAPVFQGR
ncbi:MAG: enoyl-CoA hydratase-related protein [Polaromonas sp.]|nr:enoyl-CoA hydratase-related protein [Polaromonas sp.]